MKFKKLAAKISSFILITLCCSFTKTFSFDHLPRTNLIGRVQEHGDLGTEIYIHDIDTRLISKKDKNFERTVNQYFSNLREIYKNVFKVTYEGIVYEVNTEKNILSITELNSPTGILCKGAIDLLNVNYQAKETYQEVRDSYGNLQNVVSGYQVHKPFGINKVVMSGEIRKIPSEFFTSGNMSTCRINDRFKTNDLPNSLFIGITVKELDLSQITSERLTIERWAFSHCSSIEKIILPLCYVNIVETLHETAKIENIEYARYKTPNLYGGSGISCCTVA